MIENNRIHAKMVLRLGSGLGSALSVAEATGALGELLPMMQSTCESLNTCDYRDEEDFADARELADNALDMLEDEGCTRRVRAEIRDLIRSLNIIYKGFFA